MKLWEVEVDCLLGGGLAIDPTHRRIAAGGKSIRVYDLKTGQSLSPPLPLKGDCYQLAFSHQGHKLWVRSFLCLKLFLTHDWSLEWEYPYEHGAASMSGDGQVVALAINFIRGTRVEETELQAFRNGKSFLYRSREGGRGYRRLLLNRDGSHYLVQWKRFGYTRNPAGWGFGYLDSEEPGFWLADRGQACFSPQGDRFAVTDSGKAELSLWQSSHRLVVGPVRDEGCQVEALLDDGRVLTWGPGLARIYSPQLDLIQEKRGLPTSPLVTRLLDDQRAVSWDGDQLFIWDLLSGHGAAPWSCGELVAPLNPDGLQDRHLLEAGAGCIAVLAQSRLRVYQP